MFYVQSKDRTFTEGPFDTYKQAATCARINARKLATTLSIVRRIAAATPESTHQDALVFGDAPTLDRLGELYDTLESFDWFYAMSDDHRVWKRGEAAKARLMALVADIDGGQELYDAYHEHVYSGDPWGTEKAAKPTRPE